MNFCEKMNGKNVLITGGTGLIGMHLVRALLTEGANVLVISRSEDKIKDVFEDLLEKKEFSYRITNIAAKLPEDLGIVDYIFHAASPIASSDIINAPINVIDSNLVGTRNCLDYLCRQKEETKVNGRLVIFSSATVYGAMESNYDRRVTEKETTYTDPLHFDGTPYSESKRMIEVIARAYYKQYGIESVIVRISYVYGYAKVMPQTAFYEFLKNAMKGNDISIKAESVIKRDNIYIDDAVNGIITVALLGQNGEAYNVSSNSAGGNYDSIVEIAETIAKIVNVRFDFFVNVVKLSETIRINSGVILDNTKLKNLGWNLCYSLEDGINELVQQYSETEFSTK